VRGSASLEHAGLRSALLAGTALSEGDTITTATGARVKLHFGDGSEVRLGENAELKIVSVKVDPAAGTRNILLQLPIGLLRAVAAKFHNSTGSSFEIHTGIAYSAVRGTQWIVDADKVETNVYVQEGRVAVGADFETSQFPKLVEAGHWIHVTRQTGIGAVQDSPPGSLDDLFDQTEASLAPGDESVTDVASNGVLGSATNTVSTVTDTVAGVAGSAVDTATSAVSNVTGAVAGVAGTAVDTATSAVSTTSGAVTSTVNAVVSTVTNATNSSSSSSGSAGTSSGGSSSGGAAGSSSGSGSSGSSSGSSSSGSSSGSSGGKLGGAVRDALGKVGGLL
jgi:hypothetical protein